MPEHRSLRRANRPHSPHWGPLVALLMTAFAGCSSLGKNPVPDNVIEARQLSLRGIDAVEHQAWDEAERLFSEAIKTCPADERAHRRYAEVLWRRGATSEAIEHMEESVRLSGGDPQRRVRLGEMYLERGDVDAASRQAETAIQTQRKLASAWALRGDIQRRQQRLDEALVSYHRALSYQPQFPHVQLAAAEVYRTQNRPRRALATLEVLASQYPPVEVPQEVLFLQGLALKAMDRHDDAVVVLAAAAERGPASAELLFHLGEAQLAAGDVGSAKLAARAAMSQMPDHQAVRQLNDRIDQQQQRLTAGIDRY